MKNSTNVGASASAFTLTFYTAPPLPSGANCGGVLFRGAGYVNGQSVAVAAGTYPIAGDPCTHWGLENFSVSDPTALSVGGTALSTPGTSTNGC